MTDSLLMFLIVCNAISVTAAIAAVVLAVTRLTENWRLKRLAARREDCSTAHRVCSDAWPCETHDRWRVGA